MKPVWAECGQQVEALIGAALAAAEPGTAVRRFLHREGRHLLVGDYSYDLDAGRVFLVSVGKAAVPMARAAVSVLGDDLAGGVVLMKKGARAQLFSNHDPVLMFVAGGHPVSDEDSVAATTAVTEFIAQATVGDLLLFLISGGASALLTQPLISLSEWQQLTKALLASGCAIHELNCVRRQLDRVKGGGLARMAAPATCMSLILSDVIGNSLADIGSGPTVLLEESPLAALAVLRRYDVARRLDTAVWQRIESLLQRPDLFPTKVVQSEQVIVGDVRVAATAVYMKAAQLGFLAQILTTRLEGEAREVGKFAAALAQDMQPNHCLILGGETTVTVRGTGQGGRNLEVALAAAVALRGCPNVVVVTLATDGEDSTTGMAGAMVTGETAVLAEKFGLNAREFLANNDSYTFFQQLDAGLRGTGGKLGELGGDVADYWALAADADGDEFLGPHLIQTGPTGTNVNDLIIVLTYEA